MWNKILHSNIFGGNLYRNVSNIRLSTVITQLTFYEEETFNQNFIISLDYYVRCDWPELFLLTKCFVICRRVFLTLPKVELCIKTC